MKTGCSHNRRGRFLAAFSLVEVVIALGVASFALLTIIGVFGGVLRTSEENTDRQALADSVDTLRSYLNATNFSATYDWVKGGKELLYVTYKADADGEPDPASSVVSSRWMPDDAPDVAALEAAREGRWIRARLGVSPSNPGGTNLPALNAYTKAGLFILAELDSVEAPGVLLKGHGRLQVTLSAQR